MTTNCDFVDLGIAILSHVGASVEPFILNLTPVKGRLLSRGLGLGRVQLEEKRQKNLRRYSLFEGKVYRSPLFI